MRAIIFLMLAGLLCAPASAQQNEVVQHFRAYREALLNNDYETAEREAQAALEASQTRDGNGGRTGILALNLATARLARADAPSAVEPARLAFTLAQAGAQGLDPVYAELVLARAELRADGRSGADRMTALFERDELSRVSDQEVYLAAADLGSWSSHQRDYETSEAAWSMAASRTLGSEDGDRYRYGRARTWQAAAIFNEEIGRRGSDVMDERNAQGAYRMLSEAIQALRPLADREAANLSLTISQRAFAEALALQAAMRAKLLSDGQDVPEDVVAQGDADGGVELGQPLDLSRPRCLVRVIYRPLPEFPSDQAREGRLAGLVLRIRIDAAGAIAESEVVARVGEEEFARAAERVANRWGIERRADSPANCRMESNVFIPVTFAMR